VTRDDVKDVTFYAGASGRIPELVIGVHYELYDGLPAMRKWVSVHHTGKVGAATSTTETVDTLAMELLRSPNWAPERMTVDVVQCNNPTPNDQQVPPDRSGVRSAEPVSIALQLLPGT
jgi:hypothetical protein